MPEASLPAVGWRQCEHVYALATQFPAVGAVGARTMMPVWKGLRIRAVDAPAGYFAAAAWLNKKESL